MEVSLKLVGNDRIEGIISAMNASIGYFVITIKQAIEIEEIFISKEYRNNGIGSKVIEALKILAKEFDMMISIRISILNENTINFYRKAGFIPHNEILELHI